MKKGYVYLIDVNTQRPRVCICLMESLFWDGEYRMQVGNSPLEYVIRHPSECMYIGKL